MNTTGLVTAVGQSFNETVLFGILSNMLPLIVSAFTVGLTVYLIRRILRRMGKLKGGF